MRANSTGSGRAAAVIVVAFCALALVMGGCGSGGTGSAARTSFVVCVDSTYSTANIRAHYLPDLLAVEARAAMDGARTYVDACGSNATGTVDWKIEKDMATRETLEGALREEAAASHAKKLEPELDSILAETSQGPGTPLGKILAVMARQCEVDPGPCRAFVLTDAAWDDGLMKAWDGVSATEEQHYLARFGHLVGGLRGVDVYFSGVGLGTHMGEQHLHEARRVAKALVKAGGGKVVSWDVNLGAFAGLKLQDLLKD
jgi:hypothetical protein